MKNMFKVADLRNKILFTLLIIAIYRMGSHVPVPGSDIDLIPKFTVPRVMLIVMTLPAGTVMVMWLGEVITQRGIGRGMSILIFVNVVAGMPAGGAAVKAQGGMTKFIIIVLLSIA